MVEAAPQNEFGEEGRKGEGTVEFGIEVELCNKARQVGRLNERLHM